MGQQRTSILLIQPLVQPRKVSETSQHHRFLVCILTEGCLCEHPIADVSLHTSPTTLNRSSD